MTKTINLKIGVSGIRGIVGDFLDPSLVSGFASAFGEYVGAGRVVVGRDTRSSGPMFEDAVVAGLLAVGCQPVVIGVAPTPSILIMVDQMRAKGGVAITASHNPVEWNALKFISSNSLFLNHTESAELLDIYNQPDTRFVEEQEYRRVRYASNAFDEHRERIFNHIDVDLIRSRKFKVAVDCCNGVGAVFSRDFLEELGCEVFTVNEEADGIFRRAPEPIPQNLTDLIKTVKDKRCDIGFAQDPDGDRIALLDETGTPIGEQYSLVLAAEHILSHKSGNVVANIQTTKALEDVAKRRGAELYYAPVGEINVTTRMLELDAIIGGEGSSGGVIWPNVHPCRDSFTAMALTLEMLAERKQTLSRIMSTIPQYKTKNIKVKCNAQQALETLRSMATRFADQNPITVDGLRLNWEDSWVLVRPSNTEPVIRITAEADSQSKADELAERFAKIARGEE